VKLIKLQWQRELNESMKCTVHNSHYWPYLVLGGAPRHSIDSLGVEGKFATIYPTVFIWRMVRLFGLVKTIRNASSYGHE